MKINGNSVKPGMIVEHKNDLWVVTKSQSVKPGKGGAFNQVEMKSLKNGSKLNERFRASEAVSYTHLRAHETCADLVCRLLLEKKKN